MSEAKRCRRCGDHGPTTYFRQGDKRVGVCANQHKISEETIGSASFEHERLARWLRQVEQTAWREAVTF